MEMVKLMAEYCSAGLELVGVGLIVLNVVGASLYALLHLALRRESRTQLYHAYRNQLVKGILLGLEILVAADIIRTVALELTFTSVGVLAAIVLIRTFLSFTLELEMTGRWPWQLSKEDREQREF